MTDTPNWNAWFSRLRLGRWMDNGATAWLPFHGVHIFIAGETGYGKSNTERVILKELWPGIRAGAVEVIGFDAQLGVELQEAQDAGLLKEFYYGKEAGTKTEEFKDGKPYEEEVYLQSLRRRGSLIVGTVGLHTGAGWKMVAGFQKLSEHKT